jgi:UDP-N-acetylmuramyl pentapeptide phosphotransferase/UDP-N-acetylglucosamine-1-phosphate transferase
MIDLPTIIQPKYWFELSPAPMSGTTEKILLAFFVAIFIAGIFLRIVERRKTLDRFKTRLVRKFVSLSFTMSCFGLLFLFFSFEQVRLFGSRFWYLFWLLGLAVWTGFILYDYFKVAPRERLVEEVRRQREKYLPRKKK